MVFGRRSCQSAVLFAYVSQTDLPVEIAMTPRKNDDELTLDPQDWIQAAAVAHKMIDDAIVHLSQIRSRPVWQPMPDKVRNFFTSPPPKKPSKLSDVYEAVAENLMPYAMGNNHPRFWGWYMGSGNFTGALADFLAAIEGSNLGGGNTAAVALDKQVVSWLKSLMGFPENASGMGAGERDRSASCSRRSSGRSSRPRFADRRE